MVAAVLVALALACPSSVASAAPSADGGPTDHAPAQPSEPVVAGAGAVGYDPALWVAVKELTVDFGNKLRGARVILLQSKAVTGEGGVGNELNDVNVIVVSGARVLYRFKSYPPHFDGQSTAPQFFLGEPGLELKDVTGDGVPEILFGAGFTGASDYDERLHVLHYDVRLGKFTDVRDEEFRTSGLTSLTWLEVDGAIVAVQARGVWGHDEGHYGAHYYEYAAFCWNGHRQRFVRIYATRSRDKLNKENGNVLSGDEREYVLPGIRRATNGCARRG